MCRNRSIMPPLQTTRTLLAAVAGCCLLILFVTASKALTFVMRVYRARQRFLASPIPGPPLPSLIGHITELLGLKAPFKMATWESTYGPLYKMHFLDNFTVVLGDPDTITRILRKSGPGPYMPKPHAIYQVLEAASTPRRPNLVSADDGDYWKAVRQAAAPCFSMSNLKQVVPLAVQLAKRVAEHISRQETVDIPDAAKRITSDIMGQLLYGEDLRGTYWESCYVAAVLQLPLPSQLCTLEGTAQLLSVSTTPSFNSHRPSEYLDLFYPVIKAQAALFNNPLHLWMLWDPEVRLQRHCLTRHDKLMGQKVKRLRDKPPAPHTIAAHLLAAIDPATGKPLDDSQVKAEVSIFMAGGFETTSHAITWCLTLLAAHANIQDTVFTELQAAGLAPCGAGASRQTGRDFEASDVGRLPLLSAVIKEALRLCAPAPAGGLRQVVQEEGAELCGYHVPKGTLVMLPTLPYGMSKHIYGPDASEFKPQRWMGIATAAVHPHDASKSVPAPSPSGPAVAPPTAGGEVKAAAADADAGISPEKVPGAAAVPADPFTFLTGTRDCIGQNLAKLELQVVLATLLSRFTFSPGPELAQELHLAAATGQPVVNAVHALAGAYITLQPLSGHMMLRINPRT